MAARSFRFRPNRRNIAGFLKSEGTREVIEDTTRRVERAAAAASEADGQFRTDVETGDKRVRGAVIGDYSTNDLEVSRAALLRGLDGGRGGD
ncbi:hypothetical protein [Streptomyces chryseus]|uniref:hypothetical protein n=1 Tax=Streptomyces chryseus TaxID=68186 RepID=UPI00110F7206|nr:hypothetical protein [Streptomyces chryseus]GGX01920.1 hypothetical protein GCM10010353_16920 [Streptomyces chryseus]